MGVKAKMITYPKISPEILTVGLTPIVRFLHKALIYLLSALGRCRWYRRHIVSGAIFDCSRQYGKQQILLRATNFKPTVTAPVKHRSNRINQSGNSAWGQPLGWRVHFWRHLSEDFKSMCSSRRFLPGHNPIIRY